ncbi:UNVERIFIED_CONTAM: putative mitochondrial protein [Sesamum latifolium]|uniref:Mitochondrial protein n=1 Tax=Sesamum latifolium TaxID=2727402 RepID=A0AAW2WEF5_9LAMI
MARFSIKPENKMELYLGLPSRAARSKRELFAIILDRIWQKITGWNEKLLSQVGKEVLIKSAIQEVPTYAMGCFRLPITLLKEIHSMVANFWWSNRGKNKIHWISWNRLCESKLMDGLGFRQLHLFNLAMLAKQLWRIWIHPDKLISQVLNAKYFPNSDVFSATLGSRPSFTWRSILAAQYLFRAGCRWRVGSGSHIRVWFDPWFPQPHSFRPITPAPASLLDLCVSDLIDSDNGDWNVRLMHELFWPQDNDVILCIPLSRLGDSDLLVWHYSRNGMFSIQSAYHLACSLEDRPGTSSLGEVEFSWWRKVWQSKLPNKVKVFVWRACLNALPTSANLIRRIPGVQAVCPFCSVAEDILHSLVLCPFACQTSASIPFGGSLPSSQWQAPSQNSIKVNFDGANFDDGKEMGVGVVARNASGVCVAWGSRRVARPADGEMAEAVAAREAVQLAIRKGWRSGNVLAHSFARTARDFVEGDHDIPLAVANFVVLDTTLQ